MCMNLSVRFQCGGVSPRFLEVKEMVDEDVVALMYEFEMSREAIESYKEGTHADLMEMAQSFLDLSTYSFENTMGVCNSRFDSISGGTRIATQCAIATARMKLDELGVVPSCNAVLICCRELVHLVKIILVLVEI